MENSQFKSEQRFVLGIFCVGFLSLMFELIQVRMLCFFMGSVSNFLAIPVALLGLSLGSLYCHYIFKGDKHKLITLVSVLVYPIVMFSIIMFFATANKHYSQIHAVLQLPQKELPKLLIYSALFILPYFLFGILLAAYFSIGANRIGRLYFFDLSGAALGCLVTPLMFTYFNLQPVLLTMLFFAATLAFIPRFRLKRIVLCVYVIAFCIIAALTFKGAILTEHPDARMLSRTIFRSGKYSDIKEVAVRWNELTRTSLVMGTYALPNNTTGADHVVIQDDGRSNVWFSGYTAERNPNTLLGLFAHSIPYHLGMNPKKILVMFAGTGRDMVILDTLASGKADITGVEINRAVVDFVRHPSVAKLNLRKFLARKNIRLLVAEGRDFLNNSREKFDYIFAATNGAVEANRIGNTRKYLDTYEAMASYLNVLANNGMIVFYNQPVEEKILSFKKLFAEKGIKDFKSRLLAYGMTGGHDLQTLFVKPSGFTKVDNDLIVENVIKEKGFIYLSPYQKGREDFEKIAATPIQKIDVKLVVDDKPFTRKIELDHFTLIPSEQLLNDIGFASDWIKIFTVIFFAAISFVVIMAARFLGAKQKRLPLLWLLYFFISGIAYMCVEIGLIAKTELFMGNPLYAIAVILALFLLSNSLGAIAQDKFNIMRGPLSMALYTGISIAWSVAAVTLCNKYFLSWPTILKIFSVALAVSPCGMCLGMFFPSGVTMLLRTRYSDTVSACYAIATLSSVLGSAFAMTAIANIGFSVIIGWGAIGYVSVALICMAARRFSV